MLSWSLTIESTMKQAEVNAHLCWIQRSWETKGNHYRRKWLYQSCSNLNPTFRTLTHPRHCCLKIVFPRPYNYGVKNIVPYIRSHGSVSVPRIWYVIKMENLNTVENN